MLGRPFRHVQIEAEPRRLPGQPREHMGHGLPAFAGTVAAGDEERLRAGHRAPRAVLKVIRGARDAARRASPKASRSRATWSALL